MNLSGKQVLVLGLGESGLAMARWIARQGGLVRVADSRDRPPNVDVLRAAEPSADLVTGSFAPELLSGVDLVALSPGVPLQTPLVQSAIARRLDVVSEVELFAWGIRTLVPQSKVVAITGSNGKTTTTALTAHLLNAVGCSAVACGNISPSVLDALMTALDADAPAPDVWVLELSSFQLETTYTLNADAAALLNISEDHLDRHAGMDAYAATKARVFRGCGVSVVNRDDSRSMACRAGGRASVSFGMGRAPGDSDFGLVDGFITRGDEALVALGSLGLVGLHNAANAMAALALCQSVGVDARDVVPALRAFSGLAHRVEFVAQVNGVSYYDDSKGTNVGATLAAVQGMGRQVALILGGEGKDQDFAPLTPALAKHARAVALIGRDARLIATAIADCGVPMRFCSDMEDAVRWSASQAVSGDAVLLSPACASFDMFRNYGHRAEVFVGIVHQLEGEAG